MLSPAASCSATQTRSQLFEMQSGCIQLQTMAELGVAKAGHIVQVAKAMMIVRMGP